MLLDMNDTQVNLLHNHLLTEGSISPLEAAALYRVGSFHRRMRDLWERGVEFRKERKVDATGHPYVRYYYAGQAA